MSLLNQKTNKKELKNDHYQTPYYAIEPLLKYIPKNFEIYDPACGEGKIVEFFRLHGFLTWGTDIINHPVLGKTDFLQTNVWTKNNCAIVTNPPFSLKTEFLEKAFEFKMPFAFLMNITSIETQRRQKIFQNAGMQLLLPNKRISYIVDGVQTNSSWFYSAWFLFGFNLESNINYVEINK